MPKHKKRSKAKQMPKHRKRSKAKRRRVRKKTGRNLWSTLATTGLTTAAQGLWNLSAEGRRQRKRNMERLNKLRAEHYANHYHYR